MLELLGDGALDCSPTENARAHLGLWSPEGRPPTRCSLARDNDVAVLFSGYMRGASSAGGEAQSVLARYRADDWSWLRHANGVFALAVVDWREDRCVLAVDRLGLRPLYFLHDETGVAFGEDLGAVTAKHAGRLELDHDTLQELTVIGFPLSNRTFVRKAERVPPGTCLDVRTGRRSSNRYWSLEALAPIRPQNPRVFLDESQERLRRALAELLRQSSRDALCLLSSGYDSRRLLLEGHAVGANFAAVTSVWPYPGRAGTTIEPAVTAELCRRLGVSHRLVALPQRRGAMDVRSARALRDALLDFQVYRYHHIWAMPLVASLGPSDTLRNFDGLAGDTLFNNPFYSLRPALWGRWRLDDEVLEAIAPGRDQWDRRWGRLLSRSLASRLREALAALPEGPNRLSFFYLLGRTRAMTALLPYGLLNVRVESFCPYVDNDVMEHALTFDPVEKSTLRLQAAALQRHFPAFADIPSSHSPVTDVPPSYVAAIDYADPDFVGRFTGTELEALLRARLFPPFVPRSRGIDLAFATCHTVGIPWPRRRARESRVRSLVQAAQIVAHFGRDHVRSLIETRATARASLDRYRSVLEEAGHAH